MEPQTTIEKIKTASVFGVFFIAMVGIVLYDAHQPKATSLGGSIQTAATAVSDVTTAEDAYFQKTGSYLQVKSDGTTPDGKIAATELKVSVVDYEINTYVTPKGEKGYFIVTDTPDGKAVIDYGNGGFSYTPVPRVDNPNATSTP